jgi:hypothetical protein
MLVLKTTCALEKLDCRLDDFDVGCPVLSLSIQKLVRLSDLSRSVASQQEGNVIAPVASPLSFGLLPIMLAGRLLIDPPV